MLMGGHYESWRLSIRPTEKWTWPMVCFLSFSMFEWAHTVSSQLSGSPQRKERRRGREPDVQRRCSTAAAGEAPATNCSTSSPEHKCWLSVVVCMHVVCLSDCHCLLCICLFLSPCVCFIFSRHGTKQQKVPTGCQQCQERTEQDKSLVLLLSPFSCGTLF